MVITASGTITDENFYEICYDMNYIAENKSCFEYFKGRLTKQAPLLAKSLDTKEKQCLRKLSDSIETLGIRGTIWGKTEKVFSLYAHSCLQDRKNILAKKNSIVDRATRDYVRAHIGDLRMEVRKL